MGIGKRDTPFLSRHMLVNVNTLLDGLFEERLAGGPLHLICMVCFEREAATHPIKPRKGFAQLQEVMADDMRN
jgi:hypothetical protein